jgi:hypothetical protein
MDVTSKDACTISIDKSSGEENICCQEYHIKNKS